MKYLGVQVGVFNTRLKYCCCTRSRLSLTLSPQVPAAYRVIESTIEPYNFVAVANESVLAFLIVPIPNSSSLSSKAFVHCLSCFYMKETRGRESDPEIRITGHDFDGSAIPIELFFLFKLALFLKITTLVFPCTSLEVSWTSRYKIGMWRHVTS